MRWISVFSRMHLSASVKGVEYFGLLPVFAFCANQRSMFRIGKSEVGAHVQSTQC